MTSRHAPFPAAAAAVLAAALILAAASPAAAEVPGGMQNLAPFTALRAIRTERFDIVFPESARSTALRLADSADAVYDRVSGLLGVDLPSRVPVVVTPASEAFNGYMNPFPYPHIVLYDTPQDLEWTSFRDSLEGLFLHELTHAVSLSSRGAFPSFLRALFGGWVLPAGLNAPMTMVEGVTVSFESLEGFGRANDPAIKQRLRQAAREGLFLDPFQAAGAYDLPPGRAAYYEYGGLFSAYLQERWGMEKYAALWKAMGSRLALSVDFWRHGYQRMFEDVYGLPLKEAWADFADSLYVAGLEDNRAGSVVSGELSMGDVDAAAGRVYFADALSSNLRAFDPVSGKDEVVLAFPFPVSSFDVSDDGSRVVVAGYRTVGGIQKADCVEYDLASRRPTGRSWGRLYKPRYFRGGVVGLEADLHRQRLVWRGGPGESLVLLEGDESLLFSAPAPLGDDRVAFVYAEDGVRSVGLYDFRDGRAYRLRTEADEVGLWRWVRGLRASDGRLYVSYVDDDRFYKLAELDVDAPGGPRAAFSGRDFSGGVQDAVAVGGSIFYRAAYATWDALSRFPGDRDGIAEGGFGAGLVLEPLPPAFGKAPAPSPALRFPERPFHKLAYLNPFSLWLPFPLMRVDASTSRIDGAGFIAYLADPTDMNVLTLMAGGDAAAGMAFVDLKWKTFELGLPVNLAFSDGLEFEAGAGLSKPYRATRASAAADFSVGLGGERARLYVSPSIQAAAAAADPGDGSSAYGWTYGDPVAAAGVSVGVSSRSRAAWKLFGSGSSAVAAARSPVAGSFEPRLDAVVRAGGDLPLPGFALPVRATAYGAWDPAYGMGADGSSGRYGQAPFAAAALSEYAGEAPGDVAWVAGGEVEAAVVSIETQASLSHVYFNRFFASLGWRGGAYAAGEGPGSSLGEGARFAQSLVVRAGAVVSGIPVAAVPLRFGPHAVLALKLSNLADDDRGNDWRAGFGFSFEW